MSQNIRFLRLMKKLYITTWRDVVAPIYRKITEKFPANVRKRPGGQRAADAIRPIRSTTNSGIGRTDVAVVGVSASPGSVSSMRTPLSRR